MDIASMLALAAEYALPAVFALVVFIIGRIIANKISASLRVALDKAPNSDPALSRFFANLVKYILLLCVVLAALGVLGVDTTSVSAVVLGAGAALAFVMQDALGNFAAGVMLLLFRPFNVGDEVEIDGIKGVVTHIEMTATRLKTRDNVELIIANGRAWGGVIRNHTALGARRLDMDFGISYDADIDKAIAVLMDVAAKDSRIHKDPMPWAKVVCLNESSVDIQLRVWSDYNDLRALKVSISQPIKEALDAAGIGIPYPHEVKIKQKVKTSKAWDRSKKLGATKNKMTRTKTAKAKA